MKKIVFFDIDGTLLDHEKKIPAKTKEAIKQLKENGVFVAIATGRSPFMFKSLREELDIDSYVSFNGQYVVFENEVIYKNPLHEDDVELFLQHSYRNDHSMLFMNENTMKASVTKSIKMKESMGSLKFPHPEKDLQFYKENKIYQCIVFCNEGEEEQYIAVYSQFKFIRWHTYGVDILPAGGSKAEGIHKLIDRLGFKIEDVYAFGDALNDIEMLQAVGTGVAMGNATEEVKKFADIVTNDVDQDGIWNGLKKCGLI
ncbi:Cof-type HAD-IIB family hydrolase [Bacillus sp. 03113]|uniref:Cof-type HAD-IIB family hydrolase n=1 Tax=Bacillus sp. 03113 TaxID=2578211 RepID=UPI0011411E34|nr:Cof-type HAD-IIB family hydrolase [Bacillus sp. 03113]